MIVFLPELKRIVEVSDITLLDNKIVAYPTDAKTRFVLPIEFPEDIQFDVMRAIAKALAKAKNSGVVEISSVHIALDLTGKT